MYNSKSICLNMIVKNESLVIRRCLQSVKGLIDCWIIVDTGSTDGTPEIIQDTLKNIPGRLFVRPWKNFEENRNEALSLAKNSGDYLLMIDADEQLVLSDPFRPPQLDKDFYVCPLHYGSSIFLRILLINLRLDWKWTGIVHECLDTTEAKTYEFLEHASILSSTNEGNRSKDLQKKYRSDIHTLETALQENPLNSRNVFHLASSYELANEPELAVKYFLKRTQMDPQNLEVYNSFFRIAEIQEHKLKTDPCVFIHNYLSAHQLQPKRAEPLYNLAKYFAKTRCFLLGYLIAKYALTTVKIYSNELFFINREVYEYKLLYLFAECACSCRNFSEAKLAVIHLLSVQNLPESIQKNASLLLSQIF